MKETEIIAGNKLILQSPYHGTDHEYKSGLNKRFYTEVIRFHDDYDLLMSVYDNIKAKHNERHSDTENTNHVSMVMHDEMGHVCCIRHTYRRKAEQESPRHSIPCDTTTLTSGFCKSMKEALYRAIIKAIVHFNKLSADESNAHSG